MQLESGPAKGDRNRYLIIFLMTFAFGGYFLYDGVWGYLAKNRAEAARVLPGKIGIQQAELPATFGDTPTKPEIDELLKSPPSDPAVLTEKFGPPMHRKPGLQGETYNYYVSDYGMLEAKMRFGKIVPEGLVWTKWAKTREEILYQIYVWGAICFVVAAYALIRILLLLRLRVTLDDQRMVYNGTAIPFSDMKQFANFSPKGWVDLVYETGGNERRLRLDNYRVERYQEILDHICRHTGLADPRPVDGPDDDDDETPDDSGSATG